jgi:hypothetical protein
MPVTGNYADCQEQKFIRRASLHAKICRSLKGMIAEEVNVRDFYRCFRSFRRSAEDTSITNGVSKPTIDFVHRWSKYKRSRRKLPRSFSMYEFYANGVFCEPVDQTEIRIRFGY